MPNKYRIQAHITICLFISGIFFSIIGIVISYLSVQRLLAV